MAKIKKLNPLNDFTRKVKLQIVDTNSDSATFGKLIPLTTGTPVAFLATSADPDAEAADATLQVDCEHIGKGIWLAHFDAEILTVELLDSLFNGEVPETPYLIVFAEGDVRAYEELEYERSREAKVG